MNINPIEFLTQEQKDQIGKAYLEKVLEGIKLVRFSGVGKVNINKVIQQELDDAVSNGNFFDYMDYQKVGEELSKVLLDHVQGLKQVK